MITYSYENGQISKFALKKVEHDCSITGRSILVGVFCKTCKFYEGKRGKYVICSGHDKDDPGASDIRHALYEEIETRALCAL